MNYVLRVVLSSAGFLVLWFVFVFQLTTKELFAGAACSAFTVILVQITFRAVPLNFAPRLSWIMAGAGVPTSIAKDLLIMATDLAKRLSRKRPRSAFRLVRFPIAKSGARASAQRALAVVFVSVSPNSVVVDVDAERGDILVHQLVPAPAPAILRALRG